MNIYSRKQTWKVALLIAGAVIVAVFLWYSNTLVNNIAREERRSVQIWAEAVQKRANLVKLTSQLFQQLRLGERTKVELYAKGTKELGREHDDYTFILDVIGSNTTIPVILAKEDGTVIGAMNVPEEKKKDPEFLSRLMQTMSASYDPIEIVIGQDIRQYVYYKDSKLFSELQVVMDDLIERFISEVVINSASVPVIFTDETRKNIIAFGNLDSARINQPGYFEQTIAEMEDENDPIQIDLGDGQVSYIYYKDSFLLTQLQLFPYVVFLIIGVFTLIAYLLFSSARKAEQNQVWVGMAKETAHQLGTPLSSLMAWLELFREKGMDPATVKEIEKDLQRLETITDRFSKIGAMPALDPENLIEVLESSIQYMRKRTSSKLQIDLECPLSTLQVPLNTPLFQWVIENLFTNAVDAMEGAGHLNIKVTDEIQVVYIDITDNGHGMTTRQFKRVFQPGFTTKHRGWGLGLSLTKRIIEQYHKGKIFVKNSEPEKGTTFRIVLNKNI